MRLLLAVLLLLSFVSGAHAKNDYAPTCIAAVDSVRDRAADVAEAFHKRLDDVPYVLQPDAIREPELYKMFDAIAAHAQQAKLLCEEVRDGKRPAAPQPTSKFDHTYCKDGYCK
jgi:hypothetical protein